MTDLISQQQGALQNAIVNIEGRFIGSVITSINNVGKNDFEYENDEIVTKENKERSIEELTVALLAFYGIVMVLKGASRLNEDMRDFGLPAAFTLDKKVKSYIKGTSQKVAVSHIGTISDDVLETVREAALKGLSQQEIISEVKRLYNSEITEQRAKVVARTETNRAFTRAQYEADRQFIEQNELEGKAYKKLRTRSSNPCAFCLAIEAEGEIPFNEAFRHIGDLIEGAEGKKGYVVTFENIQAGNVHPNCSCEYDLIIRQ